MSAYKMVAVAAKLNSANEDGHIVELVRHIWVGTGDCCSAK